MQVHPAAEMFPLLSEADLQALADSIQQEGLLNPCVKQGEVLLDGRNRLAACKLAGVKPRFVEYTGQSPVAFIVAANLKRRHLDKGQKIALALEIEPLFAEEARRRQAHGQTAPGKTLVEKVPQALSPRAPRSRDQAAAAVGLSGKLVEKVPPVSRPPKSRGQAAVAVSFWFGVLSVLSMLQPFRSRRPIT